MIVDEKRQLLIYPLTAGVPWHALPDAKKINGSYFAVPRTLQNAQVLRFYNYPVAPVMDHYDWPCAPGIKPWQSQQLAANFMVLHPRCFNLTGLGGGKTLTALWAADYLMQIYKPPFRALIIAPLSILKTKWANDIWRHFLSRRSCEILHGTPQQRLKALDKKVDFYILNPDGLGIGAHTRKKFELDGFSKALAERDDIKCVIVDEASFYKDARTKRHRVARQVIGSKPYLWLMSATPTPQAPTNAYGLAKLVNNAFGKSFTTFQMESMTRISQFRWVPRKDGYEQARRLLSPSIRIDIKDIWDAPPLTIRQREVPLTPEQKKMMTDLKRDLQVMVKSQVITAAHEGALRMKWLQISMGAIYDAAHKAHLVDASPRIAELKAIIEQASHKLLVFAPFTSVLTLLSKECKAIPHEVVNGSTSPKERDRIFGNFQSQPEPRILFGDPQCMGHGLDLQAADVVCWYGPVEKSELFAQANARAHRPGQKHHVHVIQLVSNSLEKEIFRRLENNLSLQGSLLDLVARGEL